MIGNSSDCKDISTLTGCPKYQIKHPVFYQKQLIFFQTVYDISLCNCTGN